MAIEAKGAQYFLETYKDPEALTDYGVGLRRAVPGLDDLHHMAQLLVAEHAPDDAHILALGAGGGQELSSFAKARPHWRLTGVDPSTEMLRLAEKTLGSGMSQIELVEGFIDDAPEGPFDGAIAFLVLHFLDPKERLRTLVEMRRRMKQGATLVVAHSSFPQHPERRKLWLSRFAAFSVSLGADRDGMESTRKNIEESANILMPEHDEAILREAGFVDVELFYAALTWRGWVAHA